MAARAAGDLADLMGVQPAGASPVELAQTREGDMVHVHVQPHADGVGGDDVIDLARLEQRDLDISDETSHRLRQMFRASHPVAPESEWHALAWNELFINLNDTAWAGRSGINQNRAFAGVMWRYDKKSRVELGYLNQVINVGGNRENQMNHVLASTWFIGF